MTEQIPATTDHELERILSPLIDVFPQGASAERVRIYADLLRPEGFAPFDLREGVSRLIHVWERTTFPPFAKLMEKCNDARRLRCEVERREAKDQEGAHRPQLLTDDEREAQLAEIRKFRMKVFPRKPNIHTDREYRRKRLGIKVLTQAENDSLDRNRRALARKMADALPRNSNGVPF